MTKIYAVVQPPFKDNGSLGDMVGTFASLFHMASYERVCGYSLGHQVDFYDDYEDAKSKIVPPDPIYTKGVNLSWRKLQMKNAVVELEVENGQVTGFNSIYTAKFDKVQLPSQKHEGCTEKGVMADWTGNAIQANDLTAGALQEMNRLYQLTNPQVQQEEVVHFNFKLKQE